MLVWMILLCKIRLEYSKLLTTIVITKNGETKPRNFKFSNNEILWTSENSQLTEKGKINILELGTFLYERYNNYDALFSPNQVSSEIYIQSSDWDRTIQSAYLIGLGMFPNRNNLSVESFNPTTPVPTYVTPLNLDYLIDLSQVCPSVIHNALTRATTRQLRIKYKELLGAISHRLNNATIEISELRRLSLNFMRMADRKENLPLWVYDKYNNIDLLDAINQASQESYLHYYTNALIKKHYGGNFIKKIIQIFDNFLQDYNDLKMHLFSANEETLIIIMSALGIYEDIPNYGASLMIELVEIMDETNENNLHDVKIKFFYRNTNYDNNVPRELFIPGCSQPCSYKDFKKLNKKKMNNDLEKYCNKDEGFSYMDYVIMMFISMFILVVALIIIGITIYRIHAKTYILIETN